MASARALPSSVDVGAPPKLAPLPNAPREPQSSPVKGLENWGAVLAIFGSLLTRQPLTSALNAAARSMEAYNQGRYRDYTLDLQRFRTELTKSVAQNDQELKQYGAALDLAKTNITAGLNKARAVALANHDELGLAQLQQNGALGLAKIAALRAEAGVRLLGIKAQIEENHRSNAVKLAAAYISNMEPVPADIARAAGLPEGAGAAPGGIDGAGKVPGLPTLPKGFQASLTGVREIQARQIADYKAPPLTGGFGVKSRVYNAQTMAEVRRINPNYDAKRYHAQQEALDSYFGGHFAEQTRAFNTALMHAGTAAQAAAKLDNSPLQFENWLTNYVATETGNPSVTNYRAAQAVFISELAAALKGANVAESDVERIERLSGANLSPAQLRGVMRTFAELMAGRLNVMSEQYKASTGETPDLLYPSSRVVLDRLLGASRTSAARTPAGAPSAESVVRSPSVHIGQKATLANGSIVQWSGTAWVPAR